MYFGFSVLEGSFAECGRKVAFAVSKHRIYCLNALSPLFISDEVHFSLSLHHRILENSVLMVSSKQDYLV